MSKGLKDQLDFGMHKGKLIEDVYKADASYLCWARNWQRDDRGNPHYFDIEIHQLLDMTIRDDKYLKGRFKTWDLEAGVRTAAVPTARPAAESSTPAYDSWGAF